MAKFDRASLLLALLVTVIISPWIPLSQCSGTRSRHAGCKELAKQLNHQVKAEPAAIFWKKRMQIWKNLFNEIAENVCNPKQEIWENQITKIAENICNPKQERVQDSERSCGFKCKICIQALLCSDIHDVVGYLYEEEPDFDSFQNRICDCKDVKKPFPKEDDSKQRSKTGAVDAAPKQKNNVCRIKVKHLFWKNKSSKSNKHEH